MFSLPLAVVLLTGSIVGAQVTGTFPPTPLASKHFPNPTDLPYKVDTDQGLIRGSQSGYNLCNSTTEGPQSLCQTSYVNGIDDFCLWSSPTANETIADTEGETVAYCSKPGHGTRLIPAGALQGVQYMITPSYRQVVGFIDQTLIDLQANDFGGELDPHGADLRGNPLGGIMYSNNITADGQYTQIIEWHNFMGGGGFCIKVCDPSDPNAANFCQHIYDRIGCAYNAPNNAQKGTFEVCHGDNQDFPGVYTTNGAVVTYSQPPESLGPITSIPFTARVPASSNCVTLSSAQIYAGLPTPSSASTTAQSGAAAPAATAAGKSSSTATGSTAGATNSPNDASALAVSGISILGVIFATLFFS